MRESSRFFVNNVNTVVVIIIVYYPKLEFVNYDDPDYVVDQGVSNGFSSKEDDEAEIKKMREEHRRKNNEFQFYKTRYRQR